MTEFDGHTEEEVQNQTQEEKKSKQEHSEVVILVLKNKSHSDQIPETPLGKQSTEKGEIQNTKTMNWLFVRKALGNLDTFQTKKSHEQVFVTYRPEF
ncbi:Dna Topoisomerase I [Manis pentadactyla]|nr:Dna Topoisomerase I [Manis pentadactyla]